jgi:hypothetical protein
MRFAPRLGLVGQRRGAILHPRKRRCRARARKEPGPPVRGAPDHHRWETRPPPVLGAHVPGLASEGATQPASAIDALLLGVHCFAAADYVTRVGVAGVVALATDDHVEVVAVIDI